ncbi:BTAD domain-containing putative transcriptional regulator [Glycomyces harbinensis]|uniref:DNA-binding transcriptional activator of the SARP family n=1 Tax=Glycomyces harbinensis TaxID=58114 RepID=A0A1G7ABF4_9ACTN|nr:BTAD domain-containing putative transcriptional regulator [Glycomyces harbinensis]SDE12288.1 DNA-binding transcriptional activator of the SARP family [Glycomyces harbinensis]
MINSSSTATILHLAPVAPQETGPAAPEPATCAAPRCAPVDPTDGPAARAAAGRPASGSAQARTAPPTGTARRPGPELLPISRRCSALPTALPNGKNVSIVSEPIEARGGSPPASAEQPESQFGPLLRSHREHRGLTQRELAERSRLSVAAIRDLEQGRTRQPRRDSLHSLALALGLSSQDESRLLAVALGADAHAPPTPAFRAEAERPAGEPVTMLAVLGPVTLWHGGIPIPLTSTNQKAILLRLALSAGHVIGREELMDLVWGERRPASASSLLHTYIGRLRRWLQPESGLTIQTTAGGYRLNADPDRLDLARFRELASRGTDENDPELALRHYAQAARLWRGDTDVDALRNGPLIAAVTEEYVAMLCAYARAARDLDSGEEVLPRLRDLAARLELHEPLHAELITSLSASGRQAEALGAFERVRTALADQLGIQPGERLHEVHQDALRQHRRAEPKPAPRRPVIQQAPAPPPDFVGRAQELDRIVSALEPDPSETDPTAPIVAVNGAAGVGKTALALEAARRLRAAFPDGQLYADLRGATSAPVTPLEVLGRFLRALGVPGQRIGTDEAEAAALLRSELAGRRMLMVLDNAAGRRQVSPLLPGTGPCAVLVTSRRRLTDLVGATVIDLPTLPVADALDLLAAAAGAHRIAAEPHSARQLTAACGQLPLALRIAGARLAGRPAWSAADLAKRLRDESRRLSELATGELSVLASFQLSYQDLSEAARRTFRLSSLHPGDDFALDASAVLLDADAAESDRVLGELLDANMLLQHSPDRFRFHDLLGLYATRLLADDDPEAYAADRDRYYAWYLRVTTAAMEWVYPQLVRWTTSDDRSAVFDTHEAALEWLDTEAPALVALIARLADSDHRHLSWQIADQLRGYFLVHRQADRWLRSADAGLRAADDDPSARAAMHMSRGQAMWGLGRHDEALADYTEGVRLADTGGWRQAAAYLRHNIGLILAEQGRLEEAERSFQLALDLSDDELGHVRAVTLNGLGFMCADNGRLVEAVEYFEAALQINQKTGREKSVHANRSNLGMVLRQLGSETAAEEHLNAALEGYRRTSDLHGEMSTLDELSLLHTQRGHAGAAVDAARQGYDLSVIVQNRRAQAALLCTLGEAHLGAGDAAAAEDAFRRALELAAEFPFFDARATIGLAGVALAQGDAAEARRCADRAVEDARTHGFGVLEADGLAVRARCAAHDRSGPAAAAAAAAYRAAGMEHSAARVEREHGSA